MSVASDRASIARALKECEWGYPITVFEYIPSVLQPFQAYLELGNIETGNTYNTLKISWNIYVTVPAVKQIEQTDKQLDLLTETIISALTGVHADFVSGRYIGVTEPTNGAIFPALKLEFQSQTPTT